MPKTNVKAKSKSRPRFSLSGYMESSSNYLKASDIKGQRPIVTIASIDEEVIGNETKPQVVIGFVGKEKKLVVNKTNLSRLVALSGTDDPDELVGAKIKLGVSQVQFNGQNVDGIRISEEFYTAPNSHISESDDDDHTADPEYGDDEDYDDSDDEDDSEDEIIDDNDNGKLKKGFV
jgi:hypothetical protein